MMQLAAISTASLANTPSSITDRLTKDHPYWTCAYHDVCIAIDREIRERSKKEALIDLIRPLRDA